MAKVEWVLAAALAAVGTPAGAAEPVMLQCGREYQAARAAGTLNGADWTSYRVACADRLKASAAAPAPPVPPLAAAVPPAVPTAAPAPAAALNTTLPPSSGMAAMHARQKQCGAEWTAGKATLVAQAPGLTWPKFWSQCNSRLKAAER